MFSVKISAMLEAGRGASPTDTAGKTGRRARRREGMAIVVAVALIGFLNTVSSAIEESKRRIEY